MRKTIFGLGLVVSLLLTACGGTATDTPVPPTNAPTAASAAPATGDLSFTDASGTAVTLTKSPERIVCLVSLCEDILFTLGIEPVAVNDKFGQNAEFWGDKAKSFTQLGGNFAQPNLEDIAKAKPDLVIGFVPHIGLRDALKTIAPLYIMNPAKYQDSIDYLKTVGRLTGHTAQADAAGKAFLDKLAAYKAKSPNTKVPLLMFGNSVNFNIFTAGSLFGSVLSEATNYPWPAPTAGQAGSADQEPGSLQYSLEKVLQKDPDVLLIESMNFAPGSPSLSKQLEANPVWGELKAVKTKQVYEVRTDIYIFGRGTRSLSTALDDAMMKIYPDVFTKPLP